MTALGLAAPLAAVGEFLRWWGRNLAAWLPGSSTDAAATGDALLVASHPGDDISLAMRRAGQRQELGVIGEAEGELRRVLASVPAALPVLLDARGAVLRKQLSFPAVVRADLERLLSFEIDRETPFEPEEVVWGFRLLPVTRRGQTIGVELVVVPRSAFAGAEQRLALAGRPARGLEVEFADGSRQALKLAGDEASRAGRHRWQIVLLIVIAVELLALAVLPQLQQYAEARQLEAQLAQYRDAAELAQRLRERVQDRALPEAVTALGRLEPGKALELLAEVTELVPDEAYLDQLAIANGRLVLRGSASRAADVLSAIAAGPDFGEPSLLSPVALSENGDRERFEIALPVPGEGALP